MAEANKQRAILIAGPTASGKSRAGLDLAVSLGGIIINADAMQVYRELKLITARPGLEEEAAAPHRLFGHVPAAQAYSAARWLEDARAALAEAWDQKRVAIVVGGTGLYFRALEQGLSPVPQVPGSVRARWRQALSERGAGALYRELSERAPEEAARLRPTDGQRIVRSLEVLEATGEALGAHHARLAASPLAGAHVIRLAIVPERSVLYRRCDARFEHMVGAGALDEVRRLLALNLDRELPAMKAIGVAPLMHYLEGKMSLDEAIRTAQRQTRNYAKRQLTWLRHQMPRFEHVPDAGAAVDKGLDLDRHGAYMALHEHDSHSRN